MTGTGILLPTLRYIHGRCLHPTTRSEGTSTLQSIRVHKMEERKNGCHVIMTLFSGKNFPGISGMIPMFSLYMLCVHVSTGVKRGQ